MKKIIPIVMILLFSQCLFAMEYPPSQSSLIKEFGQEYYDLRSQLPYDDAGYFNLDEALRKKEECLNSLLKLLDDKEITTNKVSLFDSLNINASDTIIDENEFIIDAIVRLLTFSNGYETASKAIGDNFKKFSETDKTLINQIIDKRINYYSIYYQIKSDMPKKCADIMAKYMYMDNENSKTLNDEYMRAYEISLENGCVYIGPLYRYIDAILIDGKLRSNQAEAVKKVLDVYNKYFDKLPDKDMQKPTVKTLFEKLAYLDKGKDSDRIQSEINKKIVRLIADDKIKLKDQPQWVRKGYLRLLTNFVKTKKTIKNLNTNGTIDAIADTNNTKVINTLKNVFKKRGNVFVLPGDEKGEHYEKLTDKEKEFLKMLEN